ncbi:SDR family oxidoreductase [Pseudonocardia xishanensis]|uniref:SDR family oxidoreductase n=1 Tax=Pseudonocardia xishanensis TaxID=630995 RepID=A0ABP8RZ01_9PSEU
MSTNEAVGQLAGKRALVIGGGGGGIGWTISSTVAKEGADVAVVDKDPERAADAAARLEAFGGKSVGVVGDVLDRTDLRRAVGEARSLLGGIDVLVTVVGGQTVFGLPFVPLTEYTDEQVDLAFGLNLDYVVTAVREVVPIMVEQGTGGSIVSVGSISGGFHGAQNQAVYGASKAAVNHLARTVAAENGRAGIRMNVVSPGSVQTPATGTRVSDEVDALLDHIPLGRRGRPEDIADVVVFFASDRSRYVTGQTLSVDGGASTGHPLPHISLLRSAKK